MRNKVCIIGSGPTGIYTLKQLLMAENSLIITIYEAEAEAGKGTPYLPSVNDPAMLSNIPSIEIPQLDETLVEWMRGRTDDYLNEYGILRDDIHERQFYPRLVLGDYFHERFMSLVRSAEQRGHHVEIFPKHRVIDIAVTPDGILVTVVSAQKVSAVFDHVVLATGHHWPAQKQAQPGYFTSAWPASSLHSIQRGRLGILGTSLSAIDALMTVATSCGSFLYNEEGDLTFQIGRQSETFSAVMMSRKGLLPEADFYCPLPYLDPQICTNQAVDTLISRGPAGLLDNVFELFKQEIMVADEQYAADIGLAALTVDTFADAYYERRVDSDPFVWAAQNLAEAERNIKAKYTVPWRYAIMITHEIIAKIVPYLNTEDFARFNKSFKNIFIDEYATVPHLSIKRILALHAAGRLEIQKLSDDYDITTNNQSHGATIQTAGSSIRFDNFINATGQGPLSATELPFPTLVAQGSVQEAPTQNQISPLNIHEVPTSRRMGGIDVDEFFRARSPGGITNRIYCAAIPFLLHKMPFVQGITSAAEIGDIVAKAIIEDQLDSTKREMLLA
ncbi:FAD/NAD(P)-binding protein [Rhizobium oryziradicis]|uniref:FAD-dependent urate hydroxylase HpyO/Asp monooxygenase CreE-like FAD/NAD(P)-binding domain-containing protein n=1 Tax=Rhizobium oryziradicis TaxID=1867956 RepID=A0A1Q8ZTZ5_9HYPH|nr:FAD/NAD(P)-binding protein [Rhizobium oryziradicis]OLP45408.1 hypothetical protein BJF95_19125 [Rhizobium oryziradicis]